MVRVLERGSQEDYYSVMSVKAIDGFKPFKSPVPDGLYPALLQRLKMEHIAKLRKMFSASIRLNHISSEWCKVRVVFIPKAGKNSHTTPKDFRPISLTSFILKTMERLINIELHQIKDGNLLSRQQYAYNEESLLTLPYTTGRVRCHGRSISWLFFWIKKKPTITWNWVLFPVH